MPKLDGLRGIIGGGGKIYSNSLKTFPNAKRLRERFAQTLAYLNTTYLEGEFIIQGGTHQDVQSVLMSDDKEVPKELQLRVFDRIVTPESVGIMDYQSRWSWIDGMFKVHSFWLLDEGVWPVAIQWVYTKEAVEDFIVWCRDRKYEGIILRHPHSVYKFGRATEKEDTFWKYKRTEDAEAVILETIELEHNLNKQTRDERGYAKRSSIKGNKTFSGIAGSLRVRGINGKYKDREFYVSLGSCSRTEREWFYKHNRDNRGRYITYTYAKDRGTDEAPAEPRFKCFRNEIDL